MGKVTRVDAWNLQALPSNSFTGLPKKVNFPNVQCMHLTMYCCGTYMQSGIKVNQITVNGIYILEKMFLAAVVHIYKLSFIPT